MSELQILYAKKTIGHLLDFISDTATQDKRPKGGVCEIIQQHVALAEISFQKMPSG